MPRSTAGDTGYGRYLLGVLAFGYALNSFDRSILNLLIEPIRLEFGASDTALGVLSGPAFAIFFATLSIPIAALADRWSRRNVLALSVLLWSLMTALSGLAGMFTFLLLARMGVAIGQAGANPTSHSLLAGHFPAERRSTVLSMYALGAPAGVMLAGIVGGWGSEHLGWRGTLVLAGAPGLLLAPLLFLTLRQPRDEAAAAPRAVPPLTHTIPWLASMPAFRHLCIACALHAVALYAAQSFNPAYLARTHGWSGSSIGTLIAMVGATGMLGIFLGGFLADRLAMRSGDARWQLWVPGIATLAVIPVQLLAYLGAGVPMAVAFLFSSLLSLVYFGPSYAAVQSLARPQIRAVAASLLLFSKSLVGMMLGPLLVGLSSDLLAPTAGPDSLRLGLLLVPAFNLWSGVHFFLAAAYLRNDLRRAAAESAPGKDGVAVGVPAAG